MSDHDRLEAFARETVHQVLAPDFDSLVTTSRRRFPLRWRTRTSGGGSAPCGI